MPARSANETTLDRGLGAKLFKADNTSPASCSGHTHRTRPARRITPDKVRRSEEAIHLMGLIHWKGLGKRYLHSQEGTEPTQKARATKATPRLQSDLESMWLAGSASSHGSWWRPASSERLQLGDRRETSPSQSLALCEDHSKSLKTGSTNGLERIWRSSAHWANPSR